MPTINDFRNLIVAIPIGSHSVEVEKGFWKNHFQEAQRSQIHENIFGFNKTIRISRKKILSTPSGMEKCALVLLWGYSKGIRGSQHEEYLKNLEEISKACSLPPENWETFFKSLNRLGNLGISTITKLAYFHSLEFDGNPALILDQRIINVLNPNRWEELEGLSRITYNNASSKNNYVEYLKTMKRVAKVLEVDAAKLEFFLFGMGNVFD